MEAYMTVGIAGHIDHGKTTLTKQLTKIETDRLKEEKERAISIENGFAYIRHEYGSPIAVIDVPGHERFIRQMIAGVAGIDLVLLVIAVDEGMMPQTREHMEILRLLGIKEMFIVLTKVDKADQEWLAMIREEVIDFLGETPFNRAPIYEVDSITGTGIEALKESILGKAAAFQGRSAVAPFRLPIDSVFNLKGIGTIARGTIFNGNVHSGEEIRLMPSGQKVRVKSIQVHHSAVEQASAGQRAALHLHGIELDEIKRGDVLAASHWYQPSLRLDINLDVLNTLNVPFKQHAAVTCHIGSAALQGRLIFFDRKVIEGGESVFCQIELKEPAVAAKGDRVILRRPSPAETIGGGSVIDQKADKHKYGAETVAQLKKRFEGTDEELIEEVLLKHQHVQIEAISKQSGVPLTKAAHILKRWEEQGLVIKTADEAYVLKQTFKFYEKQMIEEIQTFHEKNPMKIGRSKADLLSTVNGAFKLKEAVFSVLVKDKKLQVVDHFVLLMNFESFIPPQITVQATNVFNDLNQQGLEPDDWETLCEKHSVPNLLRYDLKRYFLRTNKLIELNEDKVISSDKFEKAIELLKEATSFRFSVKDAKETLKLTRKYMIPFLEVLDREGLTKRTGNEREWVK